MVVFIGEMHEGGETIVSLGYVVLIADEGGSLRHIHQLTPILSVD